MKTIIAGNWKMNKTLTEVDSFVKELKIKKVDDKEIQMIIIPPSIYLKDLIEHTNGTSISVGAQNSSTEPKGAFTGEISAEMIKSIGTKFVLIGHSERREYYNETNDILKKKLLLCLENDLIPIYCVGEKLNERKENKQEETVKTQINEVLKTLNSNQIKKIIVAYEPVWAIGTGLTASPEQAQEMHCFIRTQIKKLFDKKIADTIPILYGGSVKPNNAKDLFNKADINGGLIGGASLKVSDFIAIYDAVKK